MKFLEHEYDFIDDDLPYYRKWAKKIGGPILDIGAGAGRVAKILLPYGDVYAVEPDLRLCGLLEQVIPRKKILRTTMEKMKLPVGKFQLVIFPMNVFLYLNDLDTQIAVLKKVRKSLAPNGVILLDGNIPDLSQFNWKWKKDHDFSWNGKKISRFARESISFTEDVYQLELKYEGTGYRETHRFQLLTPHYLRILSHICELKIRQFNGGFKGPLKKDSLIINAVMEKTSRRDPS